MASEADIRRELRLREYQEAGEVSRSHASLIRSGLSLLFAGQAAVIGFVATRDDPTELVVRLLAALGLWLSVVAFFNTLRMTKRYAGYMERARAIEEELGMELYTASNAKVNKDDRQPLWSGTYIWPTVPVSTGLVFAGLLVRSVVEAL